MSPRNTVARILERLVVVLSMIIVLMSVISIVSILVIQHEVRQTATTISPLVDQSTGMRIEATEAQASYRAYLLTDDRQFLEQYRESREIFSQGQQELLAMSARAGVEQDRTETFLDAGSRWFEIADEDIATGADARTQALGRSATAFDRLVDSHETLVAEIVDARQERRDRYGTAMNGAVVLMGLAMLLALAVTVQQSRRALARLARPLQALQRVVSRHQRGAVDERADTTHGADEVVDLASAFNSLAQANATMQRQREHHLDLYRVTGRLPTVLGDRDGGWDLACEQLGSGLGADATSVYRLVGEDTASLMGSWDASGAHFPSAVQELAIPGLGRMLSDLPILRAGTAAEIESTFPEALQEVARRRSLVSWVLLPMCFRDEAVGALSVATTKPHVWDEAEVQAMERFAEYAAHTLVEQRYVASLEDLDQQKSDFMATTSHELRTPLTSIAGYLELLEDGDYGDLTAPQSRALEVISRNVLRLRALIDDLLLLNRLDSGEANTERRVHDIGRSTGRVVEQLLPVAAAGGVDLVLEQPEEPVRVLADAAQIERAIGNLVSNAVKFTPAGGNVRLTTEVHGEDVRIACADTGMGIPAAEQERLFTRFFRASNAQQGEVPGTGLGLVIVGSIATAHCGRVDLDSVEGEGTTVTLTLPLVQDEA